MSMLQLKCGREANTAGHVGPKSLSLLAKNACIKFVKRIEGIGDTPYEMMRPILLKVESPDQLELLEKNSPQIIGLDGEIWLQFVKRDIPDWDTKPHLPRDPKNWAKTYRKLASNARKDIAKGAEKLKAALESYEEEKEQSLSKVVSSRDLPKEPINKNARMVHILQTGKTRGGRSNSSPLIRRLQKGIRNAKPTRLGALAPTIPNPSTQIQNPPKRLVQSYKLESHIAQTNAAAAAALATTRRLNPPTTTQRPGNMSNDRIFQEREDRLRALTSAKGHTPSRVAQLDGSSTPPKSRSTAPSNGLTQSKQPVAGLNIAFLEDSDDDGRCQEEAKPKPKPSPVRRQVYDTLKRPSNIPSPLQGLGNTPSLKRKAGPPAETTPKKARLER